MSSETATRTSETCSIFNPTCAQPSCHCIAYDKNGCVCELLPSGIVRHTCTS